MTAFKSGVKNRTCNADNQLVNPGFVYDNVQSIYTPENMEAWQ